MSEIKEIFWNVKNLSKLIESIQLHKNLKFIPMGFTESEYINLKKETRHFLSQKFQTDFDSKLVIANGHQPDFHHPGIVFKDLLISKIAGLTNGLPLHIVVDTDHFDMSYICPEKLDNNYAHLNTLHFKDQANRIYSQSSLTPEDKSNLISTLKKQLNDAKYFLNRAILPEFESIIKHKLELLTTSHYLIEINEAIREEYFKSRSIYIYHIKVSELVQLHAFKVLVEKIREHLDTFMEVHNQSLMDYRKEHKIKNHAQPIPNLLHGEMPFWVLDPVTKARNVMRVNDSTDNVCILPKAVTLTMFMRLFMTDFFIHGKGGGRYEEVSEHIIKEFFQIEAAPYEVASATMNLKKTEWFSLLDIDEKEIDLKLRDIIYSPENFLDSSHPLAIQKKELQANFKNPNIDKKHLHIQIHCLNKEMSELITHEKNKLEKLRNELPQIRHTNQVFQSRTFPFYYYHFDELIDYVTQLK